MMLEHWKRPVVFFGLSLILIGTIGLVIMSGVV